MLKTEDKYNPVFQANYDQATRDIEGFGFTLEPSKWYFWTETWSDCEGPFETEQDAREALEKYAKTL